LKNFKNLDKNLSYVLRRRYFWHS